MEKRWLVVANPISGQGRAMHHRHEIEAVLRRHGLDFDFVISERPGHAVELVARAIHLGSRRADAAFVKLNCAAIPRDLIESELFGYERGAYTDAKGTKKGLFELADGGTIFLDEVGDLHEAAQAKLLRILQDGELQRVGGEQPIRVAVSGGTVSPPIGSASLRFFRR